MRLSIPLISIGELTEASDLLSSCPPPPSSSSSSSPSAPPSFPNLPTRGRDKSGAAVAGGGAAGRQQQQQRRSPFATIAAPTQTKIGLQLLNGHYYNVTETSNVAVAAKLVGVSSSSCTANGSGSTEDVLSSSPYPPPPPLFAVPAVTMPRAIVCDVLRLVDSWYVPADFTPSFHHQTLSNSNGIAGGESFASPCISISAGNAMTASLKQSIPQSILTMLSTLLNVPPEELVPPEPDTSGAKSSPTFVPPLYTYSTSKLSSSVASPAVTAATLLPSFGAGGVAGSSTALLSPIAANYDQRKNQILKARSIIQRWRLITDLFDDIPRSWRRCMCLTTSALDEKITAGNNTNNSNSNVNTKTEKDRRKDREKEKERVDTSNTRGSGSRQSGNSGAEEGVGGGAPVAAPRGTAQDSDSNINTRLLNLFTSGWLDEFSIVLDGIASAAGRGRAEGVSAKEMRKGYPPASPNESNPSGPPSGWKKGAQFLKTFAPLNPHSVSSLSLLSLSPASAPETVYAATRNRESPTGKEEEGRLMPIQANAAASNALPAGFGRGAVAALTSSSSQYALQNYSNNTNNNTTTPNSDLNDFLFRALIEETDLMAQAPLCVVSAFTHVAEAIRSIVVSPNPVRAGIAIGKIQRSLSRYGAFCAAVVSRLDVILAHEEATCNAALARGEAEVGQQQQQQQQPLNGIFGRRGPTSAPTAGLRASYSSSSSPLNSMAFSGTLPHKCVFIIVLEGVLDGLIRTSRVFFGDVAAPSLSPLSSCGIGPSCASAPFSQAGPSHLAPNGGDVYSHRGGGSSRSHLSQHAFAADIYTTNSNVDTNNAPYRVARRSNALLGGVAYPYYTDTAAAPAAAGGTQNNAASTVAASNGAASSASGGGQRLILLAPQQYQRGSPSGLSSYSRSPSEYGSIATTPRSLSPSLPISHSASSYSVNSRNVPANRGSSGGGQLLDKGRGEGGAAEAKSTALKTPPPPPSTAVSARLLGKNSSTVHHHVNAERRRDDECLLPPSTSTGSPYPLFSEHTTSDVKCRDGGGGYASPSGDNKLFASHPTNAAMTTMMMSRWVSACTPNIFVQEQGDVAQRCVQELTRLLGGSCVVGVVVRTRSLIASSQRDTAQYAERCWENNLFSCLISTSSSSSSSSSSGQQLLESKRRSVKKTGGTESNSTNAAVKNLPHQHDNKNNNTNTIRDDGGVETKGVPLLVTKEALLEDTLEDYVWCSLFPSRVEEPVYKTVLASSVWKITEMRSRSGGGGEADSNSFGLVSALSSRGNMGVAWDGEGRITYCLSAENCPVDITPFFMVARSGPFYDCSEAAARAAAMANSPSPMRSGNGRAVSESQRSQVSGAGDAGAGTGKKSVGPVAFLKKLFGKVAESSSEKGGDALSSRSFASQLNPRGQLRKGELEKNSNKNKKKKQRLFFDDSTESGSDDSCTSALTTATTMTTVEEASAMKRSQARSARRVIEAHGPDVQSGLRELYMRVLMLGWVPNAIQFSET